MRKWFEPLLDFFSDVEDPDQPAYDPAHVAATVVITVFAIGILFWLLWTLLVFGGGLFRKIGPTLRVLFTSETLEDNGWVGYPFELGVFEGFVANLIALVLTIGLAAAIRRIFRAHPSKR